MSNSFYNVKGRWARRPGFIRNGVLGPNNDSSDFHVVMTQSRQAFVGWTESDSFRQAHAQARETPKGWYNGCNVVEMFGVVSDNGA